MVVGNPCHPALHLCHVPCFKFALSICKEPCLVLSSRHRAYRDAQARSLLLNGARCSVWLPLFQLQGVCSGNLGSHQKDPGLHSFASLQGTLSPPAGTFASPHHPHSQEHLAAHTQCLWLYDAPLASRFCSEYMALPTKTSVAAVPS